MNYVAFQYAEALFTLALEEKKSVEVYENLQSLVTSIDEDIYTFLNHPKVTKNEKKDVISKVIEEQLIKHFVFVLIDNSRIELLEDCLTEYKQILDNQNKVMKVTVYSGKLLTKTDLSKLESNLNKKHNRKIELDNILDEKIIGGIRVEYEGMVFDDTINNYLHSLKSNLIR